MLWQQFAFIFAMPFLEWIGIAMGGPIYTGQMQIITLEQFIPGCIIFDEALKSNSGDNTNPWHLQYLAVFIYRLPHRLSFFFVFQWTCFAFATMHLL